MTIFIGNLFIPIILYFQLLAQNLYPILMAMAHIERKIDTGIDFAEFSYSYTCIIIFAVLMVLTAVRNISVFVKLATVGVFFVFLIIIFIVGVGGYGFTNTHYVYTE